MAINSISGNTLLTTGAFPPVRVASTGAPLIPAAGGLLVVDGVQLVAGDRVLCKDEANPVNNGIYAANTGPWVRTTDATTNQQFFSGMLVSVGLGAVNRGAVYFCTCTDDPVVVGTSLITFAAVLGGSSVITGPARTVFGVPGSSPGSLGDITAASGSGGIMAESGGTLAFRTVLPGGYTIGGNLTIDLNGNLIAPTVNKLTLTQPATGATLTIADGKTLAATKSITLAGNDGKTATFNNSLAFAGADGKSLTLNTSLTVSTNDGTLSFGNAAKTLTVNNSGTLAGGDAFTLAIAGGKTFTVNNSLTLSGTDSTAFTFPATSDTVVTLAATQTLANKTLTLPIIAAISGNSGATGTLSSGANGGTGGGLNLNGATSGSVTVQPQAAAGTWNFNLPTSAGAANSVLTSQGGGAAMTWSAAGQLPGTATNDSAAAGNVGEYVSSSVASGAAVALTTAVAANMTSISLTAGDWDVWADFAFTGSATASNYFAGSISTTSATFDSTQGNFYFVSGYGAAAFTQAFNPTVTAGPRRLSLATTTTVYAVAQSGFSGGTTSAYGQLRARRVR
jgi:hypothetical protein